MIAGGLATAEEAVFDPDFHATLRMRSASLMRHITSLAPADYATITLDRPGPRNRPKVHEDPAVKLTSYPGTVRQLIVIGLGREQPTGYANVTPDTIQRRFLETPGRIITTPDTITVRLERRAFSPFLRKADLPAALPGHRPRHAKVVVNVEAR